MPVDIYGKCGAHHCSRKNERECYRNMERHYKFYLSFENSICDDYVTEKFFNILSYNVIPVTFGGANLTALGAPPRTHVDAISFGSVKKVVHYLRTLAREERLGPKIPLDSKFLSLKMPRVITRAFSYRLRIIAPLIPEATQRSLI